MESATDVRMRWRMGVEARALLLVTAALLAFGVATVYSASAIVGMEEFGSNAHFLVRQLSGLIAGVVAFAIAAKVDAEKWYKWAWPIMIVCIILLAVILIPGVSPRIHGAKRYLIGSSVQPSELGKFALIIWTAMLIVKKGDALRRLTKGLLPFLVVLGALNLLVYLEPDLSVAMMYTLIMGIILFAGGVRIGHFVALAMILFPLFWTQAQKLQYVLLRMSSFFDPGSSPEHINYQLKQSLIAVGSGGIFGQGFGQGRQQYGFLPFAYDDFIAANIGEEWGFMGILALVVAYALYCALGLKIARNARSQFLQLTAIGITTTMVITAYIHIGVAIGLLPTTGLTLPFISYGRSNLVLSMLLTGILVNIGSSREKVIGSGATDPLSVPV